MPFFEELQIIRYHKFKGNRASRLVNSVQKLVNFVRKNVKTLLGSKVQSKYHQRWPQRKLAKWARTHLAKLGAHQLQGL